MTIQLLSGLERGGAASASVRPRELRMGIFVRAQVVSITEYGGTELASKLSLGPEMNEFVTRQTFFLCETRRTRRASKRFQAELHFRAFSYSFVLSQLELGGERRGASLALKRLEGEMRVLV